MGGSFIDKAIRSALVSFKMPKARAEQKQVNGCIILNKRTKKRVKCKIYALSLVSIDCMNLFIYRFMQANLYV